MASLKNKINFNKVRNQKEKIKARLKRNKPEKNENKKTRKNKRKIWYTILSIVIGLAILAIFAVIAFGAYIVLNAPEFNEDLLFNKESTVIYDKNNSVIATLGMNVGEDDVETRLKLSYEELPEVLVDAIIATEDSRFFQHNGVDIARFLKASLGQILGNSGAGGASTLTMQVSKNALTDTTNEGIKGIIRKFTDIYLSVFKIEKQYTKQDILEMYLNSEFLGNQSWGVEQASKTYFGKSASDLSLSEAALIAGLFQAPSAYDPFIYPEKAEARRNQVLSLMLRHGYINKDEMEIAKSIPVTSMVRSSYTSSNPYQGYVDTVIEEVIEKYKVNPYKVPLEIYTYFDPSKQNVINALYNGSSGYTFKDENVQLGIAVVDNSNGALVAVGAHREETGERSYNYATMISRHPGSTIKPILDYGPAFEYLNWSTYTPLFDEETTYSSGGVLHNFNNQNVGLVTLKYALSQSLNTNALQTFRATTNEQKWNFATSLGVTPGNENGYIYESSSIGAFEGVNPKQMAGAYSAFANTGLYTEPHTVIKIIYKESQDEEEVTYTRERVMKETTSYLITNVLMSATAYAVKVYGTDVATKTGTSSYDNAVLRSKGWSSAVSMDSWMITYNPDYTIAFWYGYDDVDKVNPYIMSSAGTERINIMSYLTPGIYTTGSHFSVPKGIVQSKVEIGTIPARLPSEFTPGDLIESHYFVSGTEPTEVSIRYSKLEDPTNLKVVESGSSAKLTWDKAKTPDAIDLKYLTNYFNTGYGQYAEKYLNIRLDYNKNAIGDFGYEIYLRKGENLKYIGFTEDNKYTINDTEDYDSVVVKSAYSIFKPNQSNGISAALTGSSTKFKIELIAMKVGSEDYQNPTYNVGDTLPSYGTDTIKFIVNGLDLTKSLDKEDMSYKISKCISSSCNVVSSIDSSESAEFDITYTVNYLGNVYTEKRHITIK